MTLFVRQNETGAVLIRGLYQVSYTYTLSHVKMIIRKEENSTETHTTAYIYICKSVYLTCVQTLSARLSLYLNKKKKEREKKSEKSKKETSEQTAARA